MPTLLRSYKTTRSKKYTRTDKFRVISNRATNLDQKNVLTEFCININRETHTSELDTIPYGYVRKSITDAKSGF